MPQFRLGREVFHPTGSLVVVPTSGCMSKQTSGSDQKLERLERQTILRATFLDLQHDGSQIIGYKFGAKSEIPPI